MNETDKPGDLFATAPVEPAPRRAFTRVWRRTCAFTAAAAVAMVCAGLVSIRDSFANDWITAASNFKWIVLVTGDQVEIDEVGRSLQEIDGVQSVKLIPPAMIVDRLKQEPLIADQIPALDPAALPSVWQVSWNPFVDPATLPGEIEELKRLSGVADVAFDQRELDKMSAFRVAWMRVDVLLSALGVLGAILMAILLGRFLFFTRFSDIRLPSLTAFVAGTMVAWVAGLMLCNWLIGPFTWHLAWGGLLAALARFAWGRVRASE